MDHPPPISVAVVKRLPVSVFCAVTATPGSGMLPLFTTPWSFPPLTVASGPEVAGDTGAAGREGAGVDWPGNELSLLGVIAFFGALSFVLVRTLRRWRDALVPAEAEA